MCAEGTKRPVFEVFTPPQLSLFQKGELGEAADASAGSEQQRERKCFEDPNPRDIFIGSRRLDEYLAVAEETHPLRVREFLREQDYRVFDGNYRRGGRPPYAPAAMIGLVLYGLMKGVSSLRGLEKLARLDVCCMWVCGGIAPDHSVIGRFLCLHREILTTEFFEQLTKSIVKATGARVWEVSGDGTIVQAAASRYRKVTAEAAEQAANEAAECAAANPDDEGSRKRATDCAEAARIVGERAEARRKKGRDPKTAAVNPAEPEAAIQKMKDRSVAPSYKPSVLANPDRIIVAVAVDPTSETGVVGPMVEQAERVGEEPVGRMSLDAGYFSDEVIGTAIDKDIDLLCPEGQTRGDGSWDKKSNKKFPKSQFVYHEETDTYCCPAGETMTPFRRYKGSKTARPYVAYRTFACATCALRSKCTTAKTGRLVERYPGDPAKDALREVMKNSKARANYSRRQGMVEPVFADLKDIQGLRRFRRGGMQGVKLEFSLHAMAHNIRRLMALVPASLAGAGSVRAFLAFITSIFALWAPISARFERWTRFWGPAAIRPNPAIPDFVHPTQPVARIGPVPMAA